MQLIKKNDCICYIIVVLVYKLYFLYVYFYKEKNIFIYFSLSYAILKLSAWYLIGEATF